MSDAPPSPHREHRRSAPARLGVALVTVSDTRTPATDLSGRRLEAGLRAAGHRVEAPVVVPDDEAALRAAVERALALPGVDVVVTTGGTGLAPRDVTLEALRPLFRKELPGFGEALRAASRERVGGAAMLTRAALATARGPGGDRLLVCLPGSPDACDVALALLLPDLGHMVALANPARAARAPGVHEDTGRAPKHS